MSAPAPPAPSGGPARATPEQVRRRREHSWVAIIAIVLGALLIPAALAVGWAAAWFDQQQRTTVAMREAPASDVVRIETAAAQVTLRFAGDSPDARLEVSSRTAADGDRYELVAEGGALVLRDAARGPGWSTFDSAAVTLTLPEALDGRVAVEAAMSAGMLSIEGSTASITGAIDTGELVVIGNGGDIDFEVDAGSIDLSGGRDVRVRVDSGSIWLGGAYERLDVAVDSGWLEGALSVALEGSFSLSSGVGDLALLQPMPAVASVGIDSGLFSLEVPAGVYQAAIHEPGSGSVSIDARIEPNGGADRPKLELSVVSGSLEVLAAD